MFLAASPQDRREIRHVLSYVIAPVAIGFAAAILFVRYNGKSAWKLLGDRSAALHTSPLLGFLSNVGIIAWCAGATVALFTAWVLWRSRAPEGIVGFYAFGGAFTTLLMADDFFLIHDNLAPRYLGLPQNVVYALYAACFLSFLWLCRKPLLARNPFLLAIAVCLLGFMAGADAINAGRYGLIALSMSASKMLGIFAWAAFFILAARRDLETHLRTSAAVR